MYNWPNWERWWQVDRLNSKILSCNLMPSWFFMCLTRHSCWSLEHQTKNQIPGFPCGQWSVFVSDLRTTNPLYFLESPHGTKFYTLGQKGITLCTFLFLFLLRKIRWPILKANLSIAFYEPFKCTRLSSTPKSWELALILDFLPIYFTLPPPVRVQTPWNQKMGFIHFYIYCSTQLTVLHVINNNICWLKSIFNSTRSRGKRHGVIIHLALVISFAI